MTTGRVRAWSVLALLAGVTVAGWAGAAPGHPALPSDASVPRRVLLVSLPHVTWNDLDRHDLPNLERFVDRAAIAGLSTRGDSFRTTLADGYAILGTGARTVGDPVTDGDALGVDEEFGRGTAADEYQRRTGRAVDTGIVELGIARILNNNDDRHYGAEIGAFAAELDAAGYRRAVIANADGSQPDGPAPGIDRVPTVSRYPEPERVPLLATFRRQAVMALMDANGRVPRGRVDRELLHDARRAPFGVEYDRAAVLDAFDDVWAGRAAVLVEGSDLVRAELYRTFVADAVGDELWARALIRTDRLVGALLERTTRRDLVVVVGPAPPGRDVTLTVLAVRGPGFEPGLLRSATTHRDGFVQSFDLAPTVVDALGRDVPSAMEGTAAEVGSTSGSAEDRRHFLVRADAAAQFRDHRIGEVQVTSWVMVGIFVALLAVSFRRRPPYWTVRILHWLPLGGIGFIAATFLIRLVPIDRAGPVAYYTALAAIGTVWGVGAMWWGRRRRLDSLLVALSGLALLLAFEALSGATLVFNSVLGYSPTGAGRFSGFGNPTYAAFATSVLTGAVVLRHRMGPGRGDRWVITLFVVAVVLDAAPWFGSDVGGILSMIPAFIVTALLLTGARVRWRTVLVSIVGASAVVLAAALFDASRPAADRTHLGRLVARIADDGIGELFQVLQRKISDNVTSLWVSLWGPMLVVAVVLLVWAFRSGRDRLDALLAWLPEWRAATAGFGVLALTGWLFNDSGIAVPGAMLFVYLPATIWLLACAPDPAATSGNRGDGRELVAAGETGARATP